jgi:NAD(P)-dependent dehydrogenase (short-subunit alcohol dehydrogenase family)
MGRFEGKVAVVTGGANGIGLACAKRLASEGARVAIFDKNEQDPLDDRSDAIVFDVVDVTDEQQVIAAVHKVHDYFGPIDILVNNAGGTVTESFASTDLVSWKRDLELNLTSQYLVAAVVLRTMQDTGGAIVNVASVNAIMALGNPAYSAAKAGVVAMTRGLATEYAKYGVRVNAVAPGSVRTDAWDFRIKEHPELFEKLLRWYPGGYIGVPDDIAAAVAFLAASESRYVNGETLVVDGGLTVGNHLMIDEMILKD